MEIQPEVGLGQSAPSFAVHLPFSFSIFILCFHPPHRYSHPLLERLVAKRIRSLDTDDHAPAYASSEELAKLYVPIEESRPAEDAGSPQGGPDLDTNGPKD